MSQLEADKRYMRRAIALAKRAVGCTNPNPLVGAVVVKDGNIIGEGYHERIGELHAERNALKNCRESAEGATIYVTLEPCCHYGKTPPCTEAIIENKIKRVVIGSRDPNPKVAGKGAKILREAGIIVEEDFLREECDELNPVFFQYISTKRPYVALKYAMTTDGKIAANSGKSQWITMEKAREHVHALRNRYQAILVGANTVLQDNPSLTCRLSRKRILEVEGILFDENKVGDEMGRNPIRVVLDSSLKMPLDCNLIQTIDQAELIVFCVSPDLEKKAALEEKGVVVLETVADEGKVCIDDMLRQLGERGIDSILVEGGGTIHASFVKQHAVHKLYAYIGAQIFGGVNRFTPVSGAGIDEPSQSLKLKHPKVQIFGDDVLLEYEID